MAQKSKTPEEHAADTAQAANVFVPKLTLKVLGCDPLRAKYDDRKVELATIYGIAFDIKTVLDRRSGDSHVAITGEFEGVNLVTGETRRSGVLYLPSGIHDTITSVIAAAKRGGEVVGKIEFGLVISAVPSTAPIGYSYEAEQVHRPSDAPDLLAKLRNSIKQNPRALPKPSTAPATV